MDTLQGEKRLVPGNNLLLLTEPNTVWFVLAGSLAVFSSRCEAGKPTGRRRYLFTVAAGDALFAAASSKAGFILLAVSLEPSELVMSRLPAVDDDLCAESGPGRLIVNWSGKLESVFGGSGAFQAPHRPAARPLEQWLDAIHDSFFTRLEELGQKETAQRVALLKDRERQFRDATRRVLAELTTVAQPATAELVSVTGSPLLVAVHALGRAAGVHIHAPKTLDPGCNIEDQLRTVARQAHFRTRKVALTGKWWTRDCGPLLAFRLEDGNPVALIPSATRYTIVDPETGQASKMNRGKAAALQPFGYMLYWPLPARMERLKQTLAFALKGRNLDIAVIIGTILAGMLLSTFVPIATAALIDYSIPDADRSLLYQLGMGLIAVALGKALFELIEVFAAARLTTASNSLVQAAVWDRVLRLRPAFLRKFSTGDLSSRAMSISTMFRLLSGTSLQMIFGSCASLVNLALMFYYSGSLAFIGLAAAIIVAAAMLISGSGIRGKTRALQALEGHLTGLTIQLINGISKLRVSGTERFAFATWGGKYREQQQLSFSIQRLRDGVGTLNQTIPPIATAAIFLSAGGALFSAGSEGLSVGSFLAFNTAFGLFMGSMTFLSNTVVELLHVVSLWERAKPILAAEPEIDPSKSDPGTLKGRIATAHVTFRYRDSGPLTLEDVSIEAEAGEFVAIVGPSGSGKSTLLRLLLGFEIPTSGTIYYDGQDLNGLDVLSLRSQLGVVLQSSNLISGSIFENIAAGTSISLDQAWEAARQAGIAGDIESFPMGMHTFISEGAGNISMGQRQRLLIARALVFRPRILLFDEATSALDNRAQAIVSGSLEVLKVTRIVIAHRLSTIRNANRIYVMEKGRVVQKGNFAELAAQDGLFARMISRQML